VIPAVSSRLGELDNYVVKVTDPKVDPELAAYLSKFGAVLVCGTIERCVELIILERLQQRAHPRVLNFIKAHFKRGTNYDCEAIKQLLMRFDTDWGRKFEIAVSAQSALTESVTSCYSVRNSVAHGGGGSMGGARLRELAAVARSLIELVEKATS
jgi:hypothetical protein